jgi:CBS domain-containing protein
VKARDLMTTDPAFVTADESLARAAALMRERNVGLIPVVEDDTSRRLAGVITDRDIAIRHVAEGHRAECTVRDHMTREGIDSVHPDADVREVIDKMESDQVRRIPVVQEGRLVGIVAQADLALRLGQDREKVGEVVEKISEPAHPRPA